jgi:hypothetical protein
MPTGLKHSVVLHWVTFEFHQTSVYPELLFEGALGWYVPSLFLRNGTTTNLYPVGGVLSDDPWNEMYRFSKSLSNLVSSGALCAWNDSRGSVDVVVHVVSLKVELGAIVNWSPMLNFLSVIADGCQTV